MKKNKFRGSNRIVIVRDGTEIELATVKGQNRGVVCIDGRPDERVIFVWCG
jgi:hypothetical protein